MNKLMGFYELRDSGLPAVPWKIFDETAVLSDDRLWTIRTAINKGNDLNLPRIVGVRGKEAYNSAMEIYDKYKDKGMLVYYPYFIAEKSGVMEIKKNGIVAEAVDKDLWNFVTYGKKDVTIMLTGEQLEYIGDPEFVLKEELNSLVKYSKTIRLQYHDIIRNGKSILVEWSFAYDSDAEGKPIGEKYLVFYELRSL